MRKIIVHTLEETATLGERLGSLLTQGSLLTLRGDLGAGKTTFTKSIGKALGVKKVINSPTFTILKTYEGRMPLYHIDAYRLEGISQDLGFEEIFDDDGCCVVEWSDFIDEQLPKDRLAITITWIDETTREFLFEAIGERYKNIVEVL